MINQCVILLLFCVAFFVCNCIVASMMSGSEKQWKHAGKDYMSFLDSVNQVVFGSEGA